MDTHSQSAQRDGAVDFDDFVAARGNALWRTAWLLTGDPHSAEDLLQTALAKCWPRWASIEAGNHEAYVRRVLVTTYAAWWRRKWRGELPTAEPPERPTVQAEETRALVRRDVQVALGGLSRGQRAVIVLRYFDDLTEAQAAEALGCSVGTVKSQASRALRALRSSPLLIEHGTDLHPNALPDSTAADSTAADSTAPIQPAEGGSHD